MNNQYDNIDDNSWIKLPRDFVRWQWYSNSNMVHLYLYLVFNAKKQDELFEGRTLHRGELITTLPRLSIETSLSIKVIRLCLKRLENAKEIECQTFNRGRLIRLLNFNYFQLSSTEDNFDKLKLSRKIIEWDWTRTLHLFVHLVLNSETFISPNGDKTIGCMCVINKLCVDTGVPIESIKSGLKILKLENVIDYEIQKQFLSVTFVSSQNYFYILKSIDVL